MSLQTRLRLYKQIEAKRNRPLIVYVTSNRRNANGAIASDSVPELLYQLQRLPATATELDLLIVSDGGDPTVAWRIVSLIRERTKRFSVIVPQAAYSAATLIVLGADEVIMHPHGNLGPTDPQIQTPRKGGKDGTNEQIRFGSEDLSAFLRFSRETVGLTDQERLLAVYTRFCDEVGAVAVGVAARSALLSVTMGEKLLQLHMTGDTHKQRARAISEKLTKDYFHHGYPVNRTEAKDIGLKLADRDEELESLMWDVWCDLHDELKLREPYNPVTVLREDPNCQQLFSPFPVINMPSNLPPQFAQQAYQAIAQQIMPINVPPAHFENIHAVMESSRYASRFVTSGLIFAARLPDQQLRVSTVVERQGWITVLPQQLQAFAPIPTPAPVSAINALMASAVAAPAAVASASAPTPTPAKTTARKARPQAKVAVAASSPLKPSKSPVRKTKKSVEIRKR